MAYADLRLPQEFFSTGQTRAFKEGDSKPGPVHGTVYGLSVWHNNSSFFSLCFALLLYITVVSAPQETLHRICCLVIVTFMEICLNFKRTKHLALVRGFQITNSSEKFD